MEYNPPLIIMKSVKAKNLIEKRKEAANFLKAYPDRIPIIFEPCESSKYDAQMVDTQFLIPKIITIGQFMFSVRKRMSLAPEKAIFLFIHGFIPPSSALMCDIYDYHKDNDNFLHITYSFENTFGFG